MVTAFLWLCRALGFPVGVVPGRELIPLQVSEVTSGAAALRASKDREGDTPFTGPGKEAAGEDLSPTEQARLHAV